MMELNRINFNGVMTRLNQLNLEGQKIVNECKKDNKNMFKNELTNLAIEMVDNVNVSLKEAQILNIVCDLIKKYEIEIENISSQVTLLTNENNWLREELLQSRVRLEKAELELIEQNSKITHLEFVNSNSNICYLDISTQNPISMEESNLKSCLHSDNNTNNNISNEIESANIFKDDEDNNSLIIQNYSKENNNLIYTNPRLKTIHDLVIQALNERKYEVAIPLCKEAIEQTEKHNGTKIHDDIAAILNLLAVVYKDQENYTEARQVLDQCLYIREQIYGEDHPIIASSLNNLSVLYGKKKQFVQAEILCRRALNIRNTAFGENHPDVAKQLLNLAILNQNQAKYEDAKKYYKQSLKIYINNFGMNNPHTLKLKHKIANVYIKLKKFDKSESILKTLVVYSYKEFVNSSNNYNIDKNKLLDGTENNNLDESNTTTHLEYYSRQKRTPTNNDLQLDTINLNKLGKYDEFGEWHKATSEIVSSPSLWSILKSLLLLYKKRECHEQSQAVSNVLKNLQKSTFHHDLLNLLKILKIKLN